MTEEQETKAPNRKAAQRERDRQAGVKRVELRLPAALAEKLENGMVVRGAGLGPYGIQEYIETLIEMDAERLALQLEQLAQVPCEYCGLALPEGCGGSFKGEGACFKTREEKQLLLRELNLNVKKVGN